MYIAAKLSHFIGIGKMAGTCIPDKILVSQESSAVIALIDLYSASAEDRATVGCFFDFQEMGLPPNMMKKPLTDLLVQEYWAQSESQ